MSWMIELSLLFLVNLEGIRLIAFTLASHMQKDPKFSRNDLIPPLMEFDWARRN